MSPVILVAASLCLVAAAVATITVQRSRFDPEDAVQAYFAALADRDADEAQSLLVPEYVEHFEAVLLNDRTLGDAGYTPPRNVQVTRIDPDDQTSSTPVQWPDVALRVSYDINGARYEHLMTAVPAKGWLRIRRWQIENGLTLMPANTRTQHPLVIAGTRVPAKKESLTVPAFPGAYVVGLAKQPLLEAAPVTVIGGARLASPLQLRLREAPQRELERQVRTHIDGCARSPDADPPGCPFEPAGDQAYPAAISRQITHYPGLRTVVGSDGNIAVTSEGAGRVEVTAPAASTSPPFIAHESFTVEGVVELTDGKLTFVAFS